MKFEIINPSDEAYIEGSFKACCIATVLFGEGKYALKQVDGNLEMPLFIIGSPNKWFKGQFGKDLDELLVEMDKEEIANALLSVKLQRERSSVNDFSSYAHDLGNSILKKKAIKK